MRPNRTAPVPLRNRAIAAALALLPLAAAACEDDKSETARDERRSQQAQNTQRTQPTTPAAPRAEPGTPIPQNVAPGAAPSAARLTGTWTIMEAKLADPKAAANSDKAEGVTYRFEDKGKVTVAGAKECSYLLQETRLKIDCRGATMAGKIEFRDDQSMVWTIADGETLTFKKR